ncbi:MAG TPA: hypothetical protein VF707_16845 [Ardenticatenaceae bacterium]|jgi:hypothetical protein
MLYLQPYLDFIEHANAGRFRDALLSLEKVWLEERSEFYAGLLQLMVALNQLHLGMRPGRSLRRAHERIAPFAPSYKGLDVVYLLRFIEQCEALFSSDKAISPATIPKLTLVLADL